MTTTAVRPPDASPGGPRLTRSTVVASPLVSALGALTVLAGSAALLTTIDGRSWTGPTVQIVGLVWLIGLGCRLLRVPAPLTVLSQAAGIVVTLTAVFTTSGYGGLIPNTRAVREAHALLTGAWEQIQQSTVPAPSTPELSFLIAVTLGLIALIVDFFVSEVDAPALVALPLLCLYSVPASIAQDMLPWWTFALPAASYAVLVAVAGHPGRRVGLRAGLGVALAGGLALTVTIAASLLVADSITQIGTAGRIDRGNQPAAGSDVGLSAFASLHGDLQKAEARQVLLVNGLPEPDYLRTTALEGWSADQGFELDDPDRDAGPAGSPIDIRPLAVSPSAQPATADIQVLSFADRFVPIYQGTTRITGLGDDYRYNPELGSVFRGSPSRPNNYQLAVDFGEISPDTLRADTASPVNSLLNNSGVPEEAVAEALRITASGATAFDKALLLKDYFTTPSNGFVYSLSVPVGNSGSLLSDFLTNKQGYCEQYAAAMAIMLRSIGIPARVAIGFTQGVQQPDGAFLITSHDAHAWVEVRFDTAGWVRFDPTPLSPSLGGLQGFETAPAPSSASGSQATSSGATAGSESAGSTVAQTVTNFETETVPGDGSGLAGPTWKPAYTWVLVLLVVVALISASPSLLRRRRAASRLTLAATGGSDAPAAAWAEVEDLATDHGLAAGNGTTVRKAANRLAREGKLSEGARDGLRRIVLGIESSWYSAEGYTADPGTDLAEDVRRISVDLEHSAPRTLRRKLLPSSLANRR